MEPIYYAGVFLTKVPVCQHPLVYPPHTQIAYVSSFIETLELPWPSYKKIPWYAVEKAVATHSSTLAWKIAWMEQPGRLQSMGSHRVGHNWSDLAAAAATWYAETKGVNSMVWGSIWCHQSCDIFISTVVLLVKCIWNNNNKKLSLSLEWLSPPLC